MSTNGARNVIERYLRGIVDHDWDEVSSCVAEEVVRVGPFGDTYQGREAYVAFLSKLMPTLQDYSMRVHRLEVSAGGRCALAELTETMSFDGEVVETPEALVFDFDDDLIEHVAIYIRRTG
jgi:ketosteroid isomerase-like protein